MPDYLAGACLDHGRHDASMTVVRRALETQQAGRLAGGKVGRNGQGVLRGGRLHVLTEDRGHFRTTAAPCGVTSRFRCPQSSFVDIAEPAGQKRSRQNGFGKSRLAGLRHSTDIEHRSDAGRQQQVDQLLLHKPFVADGENCRLVQGRPQT